MQREIRYELLEKAILGTMLEENYLVLDSDMRLDYFTVQAHRVIFRGMQELVQTGRSVDPVTLLTVREPMEMGGANYVVELTRFANPERFYEYVGLLVENWQERTKYVILQQAQQENWSIERIGTELDKLNEREIAKGTSIRDYLVQAAERPFSEQRVKRGIPTGLSQLDQMTNGFQKGELFILAARPSMGKTDTMNHFIMQAGKNGFKPIVFSLEMKREMLVDRLIASTGGISRLHLRNPFKTMNAEQKAAWVKAVGELDTCAVEIDDRPGLTVAQIRATARKIMKQQPEREPIIFIDYLQIIQPRDPLMKLAQQIGQISWDLKQMAREFDCPVVCLAQLNRGVESRVDKRPMMADIRESGNIEQDADVIAFLYREEYYDKETTEKNRMEIIVAKHRNGPTGTVKVGYFKRSGRLAD